MLMMQLTEIYAKLSINFAKKYIAGILPCKTFVNDDTDTEEVAYCRRYFA